MCVYVTGRTSNRCVFPKNRQKKKPILSPLKGCQSRHAVNILVSLRVISHSEAFCPGPSWGCVVRYHTPPPVWDRQQLHTWLPAAGARAATLSHTSWRSSRAIKEGEMRLLSVQELSDVLQSCLGFWCWQLWQPSVREWQHFPLCALIIDLTTCSVQVYSSAKIICFHSHSPRSSFCRWKGSNIRPPGIHISIAPMFLCFLISAGWRGARAEVSWGQFWEGCGRRGGQTQLLALAGNVPDHNVNNGVHKFCIKNCAAVFYRADTEPS